MGRGLKPPLSSQATYGTTEHDAEKGMVSG
jgi:hypothetical protein